MFLAIQEYEGFEKKSKNEHEKSAFTCR